MPPLHFLPLLKRIRWGGRRLGTVLGKPIGPEADYAESWEIADHGADQSLVANGPLAGRTLQELVARYNAELFGRHAGLRQFPLLIKFLDATDRLSVQVHPDDVRAKQFDPSENGKTEAWVIVDAQPGSRLYAGLKSGVDARTLRSALAEGRVEDCLHSFEVSTGDCLLIRAGTVHAIGEGILLAEVQQQSDLTFRLYDWDRLGTDGRPRPLHIEESFQCIDFERGPVGRVMPRHASGGEDLAECEFFQIRRYRGPGAMGLPDDDRFHILMNLSGQTAVACGDDRHRLRTGDTLLLPAARETVTLHPDEGTVLLDIFLPDRASAGGA